MSKLSRWHSISLIRRLFPLNTTLYFRSLSKALLGKPHIHDFTYPAFMATSQTANKVELIDFMQNYMFGHEGFRENVFCCFRKSFTTVPHLKNYGTPISKNPMSGPREHEAGCGKSRMLGFPGCGFYRKRKYRVELSGNNRLISDIECHLKIWCSCPRQNTYIRETLGHANLIFTSACPRDFLAHQAQ